MTSPSPAGPGLTVGRRRCAARPSTRGLRRGIRSAAFAPALRASRGSPYPSDGERRQHSPEREAARRPPRTGENRTARRAPWAGVTLPIMLRLGRARPLLPLVALGLLLAHAALAAAGHGGPGSIDMLPVLEALALILVLARLGGALFERFKLPAVLGELAAGIVIGNLALVGFHGLDALKSVPTVEAFAQIGVLFLLFQVGLESDVAKMAAVGLSATLVAVLGVVAPMLLGLGVSEWFLKGHHVLAHWFVGA